MKGFAMRNFFKQFGKAVCYLLLFVGMQFLVSFAFQFIFIFTEAFRLAAVGAEFDVQAITERVVEAIYANIGLILILSNGLTLFALWLFFLIRKKKLTAEVNLAPFPLQLLPLLLLLGLSLNVFVSFGLALLPEWMLADYMQEVTGVFGSVTLLTVVAQIVAAPVAEEVIFRGMIFSRMRKAVPVAAAAAVSSAAFGLVHGQILWMAYAFLLGLLFCAVAWKTDSVLAAVVLHMMFNLGGVVLPYLPLGGTPAAGVLITAAAGALSVALLLLLFRSCSRRKDIGCVSQNP